MGLELAGRLVGVVHGVREVVLFLARGGWSRVGHSFRSVHVQVVGRQAAHSA